VVACIVVEVCTIFDILVLLEHYMFLLNCIKEFYVKGLFFLLATNLDIIVYILGFDDAYNIDIYLSLIFFSCFENWDMSSLFSGLLMHVCYLDCRWCHCCKSYKFVHLINVVLVYCKSQAHHLKFGLSQYVSIILCQTLIIVPIYD